MTQMYQNITLLKATVKTLKTFNSFRKLVKSQNMYSYQEAFKIANEEVLQKNSNFQEIVALLYNNQFFLKKTPSNPHLSVLKQSL